MYDRLNRGPEWLPAQAEERALGRAFSIAHPPAPSTHSGYHAHLRLLPFLPPFASPFLPTVHLLAALILRVIASSFFHLVVRGDDIEEETSTGTA
jgi:hypothetical protein